MPERSISTPLNGINSTASALNWGCFLLVLYGGAKAADRNFAIVRCVDEEIIDWLARREMRRRGRPEMEIVTNDACAQPRSGIR